MAKRLFVTLGREGLDLQAEEFDDRPRTKPPWYGWLVERLSWFVTGLAVWQALKSGGLV